MDGLLQSIMNSIEIAQSRINTAEQAINEAKSWLENAKAKCQPIPVAEPSGPKVVGKVQLGNIEQCFLEDEIQEIEEDFFEGY